MSPGQQFVASVLAVLLSPFIAVLVSAWLQDRKERKQQQLSILWSLIATRHEIFSPEAVRALNVIDLVFHDRRSVRQLWREYYEMVCNEGLNNELGYAQRRNKNLELVTEMANVLGYGKQISHLDVDRVYIPNSVVNQFNQNQELWTELLRVLRATGHFDVSPRDARDVPRS
jgi:hypothetical protein